MQSVHWKLRNVVGRQDLSTVHSSEPMKQRVLLVLDCLCGISEAVRVDNASLLFSLLCPAASDAVTLLGKPVHLSLNKLIGCNGNLVSYTNSRPQFSHIYDYVLSTTGHPVDVWSNEGSNRLLKRQQFYSK